MNIITYSAARASLAETMDRVVNDHEPVIITRSGERAVVMMSLDDYKAIEGNRLPAAQPEECTAPAGIHRPA
ncbi:type II toxin-antitoxin system Phd/YefM family antitoxin [Xanthomonas vasicola]|uniref:type II toxin-antitoxin system Phd/YefM family antitoxin n=1 Tax=Xanthomonas vasicola TaxID=56459 RepID=UPI002692B5F1